MSVAHAHLFSQILQVISRNEFEALVRKHHAEDRSKGFSSWEQFVSMLFCQLGQAHSLREIEMGLASTSGKLAHLGLKEAPKRSTLAYANEHRPWELFQDLFQHVLAQTMPYAKGRGHLRLRNAIRLMDSTTIDLCLDVFDWALFRRTKGAVKLHVMLDHEGCLPCFAHITTGKVHDVKVAQQLDFEPGTIVVVDRGYNDYRLWRRWCDRDVGFVTPMKKNAVYQVLEVLHEADTGKIRSDAYILLTGVGATEKCPHILRRIVVWDEEREREIVLLTNLIHLAATTIGRLYKERWQIELFFKALKQNFRVKTFVGTSANALKTQLWTALIAILLVRLLQLRAAFAWSLSNLVAVLRMNLFTYRDLWAWLNAPLETPAQAPPVIQLELPFK